MAKRNPLIAVLLSLFLPGTGQLYNRQPNKAILLYAMLLGKPLYIYWSRNKTRVGREIK